LPGYVGLARVTTGSSPAANQASTKLAPMNPAPPVTRIMGKGGERCGTTARRAASRGAGFYHSGPSRRDLEIVTVPVDELREPLRERRRRPEAGQRGQAVDRGIRRGNIARLHRRIFLDRGTPEDPGERRNERFELDGFMVADVVDRVRRTVGIGRRTTVEHAHDPFDNVVDVSEVAAQLSVVEYADRLACEDGLREQHRRHVGPAPRPVHGKETKTSRGQPVEMAVA